MRKIPKLCKSCVYFCKHYGNKNKEGKRVVSSFWCSCKNGKITTFPKKCEFYKESWY